MIKKVIKFTDYNGVDREETFYFDLNEAELLEMEMSTDGGLEEFINRIISEMDQKKIVEMFKSLILKSVGRKSLDGRKFEKSEEISHDFASTRAYVNLFMEISSDADKAAEFIKGILPADVAEQVEQNGGVDPNKKAVPMPASNEAHKVVQMPV